MRGIVLSALLVAGALVTAGACAPSAPSRDELVVILDTDAPVPSWVDHLHVEVYDAAGTSLVSQRDYAFPDPADWPFSFGMHPSSGEGGVAARLRVRAYNSTRPISIWSAAVSGATFAPGDPDGYDPVYTIDRVVNVATAQGSGVVQARITLRGDCLGVPADVVAGTTCLDTPGQSVPAPVEAVAPFSTTVAPSVVGSWAAAAPVDCTVAARAESGAYDEELSVPGGIYVMGDARDDHAIPDVGNMLEYPERIVQVSPFLFDRYEVSVGRFRAAMQDATNPFVPPTEPNVPDAPVDCGDEVNYRFCTWRGAAATPDATLDALPLNCVDDTTAQAFCQWEGGDLPSEAQWEYAAAQAFREVKSFYPWAEATVSCDIASYGRWNVDLQTGECGHGVECGLLPVNAPFGGGPASPDCTGADCARDVTPAPPGHGGFVGLAGNVSEWVLDYNFAFDAPCWQNAPRLDPVCSDTTDNPTRMYRGGSWMTAGLLTANSLRTGGIAEAPLLAQYGAVGFRCARKGTK